MWGRLGSKPWLVLGGGGVKGMVHVGAWRALREQGLQPGGLIGCSIGALVASCIACGVDASTLFGIARRLRRPDIVRINRRAAWVNGLRAISVFRGDTFKDYVRAVLPVREWDELALPLQVNAVDLETGEGVWFGTGARTDVPLVEAVYASAALPVFFPPAEVEGAYLVDGGIDRALPMDRAEATDATGVFAVDPGAGPTADADQIMGRGMIAVHERAISIMIHHQRQRFLSRGIGLPALVVRPKLDGYGTFDFESIPYFLEEGYRATKDALTGPRRET